MARLWSFETRLPQTLLIAVLLLDMS